MGEGDDDDVVIGGCGDDEGVEEEGIAGTLCEEEGIGVSSLAEVDRELDEGREGVEVVEEETKGLAALASSDNCLIDTIEGEEMAGG